MRRPWISITALSVSILTFVAALFAYRALRSQVLDLRADIARRPPFHLHSDVRLWMIRSQLARVERPIIVMGDSFVEAAILPKEICGYPVINAGIGGATSQFIAEHADYILAGTTPSLVVVSVGVNDILAGASPSVFSTRYENLRQSIKSPAVFGTLTKLDSFDVSPYNYVIKERPYVELSSDGKTSDGVHLTPEGNAIWMSDLLTAGCNHLPRASIHP